MTRVTMDGLAELVRNLEQFNDTANRTAIEKRALMAAGDHLRQKIQDMTRVRTGALKAAIVKGEVENGKILIGPSQQGPAFRAHFLEFGTSKMSAQPFMRPAFEASKSQLEQIMAEEIRRGLGL